MTFEPDAPSAASDRTTNLRRKRAALIRCLADMTAVLMLELLNRRQQISVMPSSGAGLQGNVAGARGGEARRPPLWG